MEKVHCAAEEATAKSQMVRPPFLPPNDGVSLSESVTLVSGTDINIKISENTDMIIRLSFPPEAIVAV